jgi:hypothetical protein
VYYLAALLEELESEDTNAFYQRAISSYLKVLGPDHPTTRACSGRYSTMLEKTRGASRLGI